nr:hypothetical protein [uncultured Muribaculum sp.]
MSDTFSNNLTTPCVKPDRVDMGRLFLQALDRTGGVAGIDTQIDYARLDQWGYDILTSDFTLMHYRLDKGHSKQQIDVTVSQFIIIPIPPLFTI